MPQIPTAPIGRQLRSSTAHALIGLVVLAVPGTFACGEEDPPPAPLAGAPAVEHPQRPTPESGQAGSGQPEAGSDSVKPNAKPPAPGPAAPTHRIVPLFDASTELEPEVLFDRGDAVVTRFGDRGRDRHAREDQFQSYDHYLPFYWEYRTARFLFVDRVAKGGSTLDVSFVTEWKLARVVTAPNSLRASFIRLPSCETNSFIRIPTCCSTTWEQVLRTSSVNVKQPVPSGGRHRCGGSAYPPA
jgi:hypothetical protein